MTLTILLIVAAACAVFVGYSFEKALDLEERSF